MARSRKGTVLTIGTRKGLFVMESEDRRRWRTKGPFFPGLEIHRALYDSRPGGSLWAAVTSYHWGPTVQESKDLGKRWTKRAGPAYERGTGLTVDKIWHITPGHEVGELWAGVEPAGLFHTTDGGKNWTSIEAINAWPGRDKWIPGGGGLCLHTILPYPGKSERMVVGASAVGAFGSGDGGKSWRLMNAGIQSGLNTKGSTADEEPGSCVHKMVRDAKDPDVLFMQNHWGIYRRRRGDDSWTDISKGLPSRFGFPMAAHPHDAGTVYTVPLEADSNRVAPNGAFAVYRTRNGGKKWERLARGLPQKGAWHTVLREGLATDQGDVAGVYVGTTTGELYASRNDGESWSALASTLPPILSVHAATL
ncbi:MAG TPA: exo-alpha-sialidase [Candidatus Thermoplasmatota archaeon]